MGEVKNLVEKIAIKYNIKIDEKTSADRAKENTLIPSMQGTNSNQSELSIGKKERGDDGILYEIMENGDRKPDLSDEQTKKILEKKKEEEERQKGIFNFLTGGGLLTGLAGIFGGLNKTSEKKETIF